MKFNNRYLNSNHMLALQLLLLICSMHAEYLISFRPPDRVINLYGFKVEILDQISTSMFGKPKFTLIRREDLTFVNMLGSGESHTAYFYKRANSPPTTPSNSLKKLLLPPRSNFSEEALEVYCDNAFYDASKLAVELKKDALQQHVTDVVIQYQDSARPKRERKPTKL